MKAKHTMLGVLLSVSVSACVTPVDPEDENRQEEPAAWEVHLLMGTFKVHGDCDGGLGGAGEFSYQLAYARQTPGGDWDNPIVTASSSGYPDQGGSRHKLNKGEELEVSGRSTINMEEGEAYRLEFRAIEWDLNSMDSRMQGSMAAFETTVGSAGLGAYKEVNLFLTGDEDCSVEMAGLTQEFKTP